MEIDKTELDKRLPKGKTCGDCFHIERCVAFGFSWEERMNCDFLPNRFILKPEQLVKDALSGKE